MKNYMGMKKSKISYGNKLGRKVGRETEDFLDETLVGKRPKVKGKRK